MGILWFINRLLILLFSCVFLSGCSNSESNHSEDDKISIVVDFPPENSNLAPQKPEDERKNNSLRVKGRLIDIVSGDKQPSDVASFVIRAANGESDKTISSAIQWQTENRGYWFADIELLTGPAGNILSEQQFEVEVRWVDGQANSVDYQFMQQPFLTSPRKAIYWPQEDSYLVWDSAHQAIFLLSGESDERLIYQLESVVSTSEPISVYVNWVLDEADQKLYWLQSYSGQSQLKVMNLSDFSARDSDALPAHLSFGNNSADKVECDGIGYSINCKLLREGESKIQVISKTPELTASMPYIFRSALGVDEDYILFTDFHNLYRFNLTSGEPEVVWYSRYFSYQDIANWFDYQGQQYLTIKQLNGDWSLFRFDTANQLIKVHTFSGAIAGDIQYAGSEVNDHGLSHIMKLESGMCELVTINYINNSKQSRLDLSSPCLLGSPRFTVESDVFFGMSVFENSGFYYLNSIQESSLSAPAVYRTPISGDSIGWELWQSDGVAFDTEASRVAVRRLDGISIFNSDGAVSSFNFSELGQDTDDPLNPFINSVSFARLPVIDQENSSAREVFRREVLGGAYQELFDAFGDNLMHYNWSNQQTALVSRVEPGIAGFAYHYLNENKHGLWLGLGERGVFIEDKDSGRQALLSLTFE